MRTLFAFIAFILLNTRSTLAQVGIGTTTPAPTAALDVTSTAKGFLPPRMTWAQIRAIPTPAAGLTVFDITAKGLRVYDGSQWVLLGPRQSQFSDGPGAMSHVDVSGLSDVFALAIGPDKSVVLAGKCSPGAYLAGTTINVASTTWFFAKLDSTGTADFVKIIIGPLTAFNDADVDAVGNIYLAGSFQGTVDFDPGPNVQNRTSASAGNSDGFIAKYTPTGGYLWAQRVGGLQSDAVVCVETDGNSLYAGGIFKDTVDFGPVLVSAGNFDGWVGKYNVQNGGNLWAVRFGGTGADELTGIALRPLGISISGNFINTATVGPLPVTSHGSVDGLLAQIGSDGSVASAYAIGGNTGDAIRAVAVDAAGNHFIAGGFGNAINFALSGNTVVANAPGGASFIVRYNASLGAPTFLQIEDAGLYDMTLDAAGNVYVTGTYSVNPFALGGFSVPGYGQTDCFLAKVNNTLTSASWLYGAGSTTLDYPDALAVSSDGKLLYSLNRMAAFVSPSLPYLTYERVRVDGPPCYISRYEE